jgi:hypothetical protein
MIRLPLALLALTILFAMPKVSHQLQSNNKQHTFSKEVNNSIIVNTELTTTKENYQKWHLEKLGIGYNLFNYAIKGFNYLKANHSILNQHLITIIDFSKPSTQKRLFVLNVNTGKILFNTLVAHGKNSGELFATSFSNKMSSLESSPGFYITNDTYFGKHGLSLKLQGCEKGINNNALERAIVMHGADYVSENFIQQNGFLGRSFGCPAIPTNYTKRIIESIKNKSCLFIYAPTNQYLSASALLKS